MLKRQIILFVLATVVAAGCGGGSSSSSPATGSATFTVKWPTRSRVVPQNADTITVTLTDLDNGSNVVAPLTIAFPNTTVTSGAILADHYSVTASAKNTAANKVLAAGTVSSVQINGSTTPTPVNVVMGTTFDTLAISAVTNGSTVTRTATKSTPAAAITMNPEDSLVLTLNPESTSGSVVMLPLDPTTATISKLSVSSAGAVSLSGNASSNFGSAQTTVTASVLGSSNNTDATGTITVTYTETGDTYSIPVTVHGRSLAAAAPVTAGTKLIGNSIAGYSASAWKVLGREEGFQTDKFTITLSGAPTGNLTFKYNGASVALPFATWNAGPASSVASALNGTALFSGTSPLTVTGPNGGPYTFSIAASAADYDIATGNVPSTTTEFAVDTTGSGVTVSSIVRTASTDGPVVIDAGAPGTEVFAKEVGRSDRSGRLRFDGTNFYEFRVGTTTVFEGTVQPPATAVSTTAMNDIALSADLTSVLHGISSSTTVASFTPGALAGASAIAGAPSSVSRLAIAWDNRATNNTQYAWFLSSGGNLTVGKVSGGVFTGGIVPSVSAGTIKCVAANGKIAYVWLNNAGTDSIDIFTADGGVKLGSFNVAGPTPVVDISANSTGPVLLESSGTFNTATSKVVQLVLS